mgnify:FL=1
MQNKFGLKDFIVLVILLAVGLSLWLGMVQDDRKWKELRSTQAQLNSIESSLARIQRQLDTPANDRSQLDAIEDALADIQRQLDAGVAVARNTTEPDVRERPVRPPAGGATAWAREGVPVTVATPWDFSVDPYEQDDFHPGGEFIEIFEGQPSKITPFLYADVYGRRVVDLITESLGWYDPQTLELRGRLAEAWQYDPDGMWLRVKIRDAARFSNGDPVLAEDVRWTFEELLFNAEIEAERFRSVYNAMSRLEVIGDPATSKVIEYHFKEPRFDNLAQAFGHKILPKSVYEAWIESPATFNQSTGLAVGSGPFRLARVSVEDQWTPPSDIVLVRNDLYWGPRPPLDSIRFKTIQDSLARLTAFESGQGDMMRPTGAQFDIKSNDPRFNERFEARKWYNMQGGYSFIAWQCGLRNNRRATPFHDTRVRQAMTMLIDRERIRRDIEKNLSRPATGPFLSSTPQADPEIVPWPYDPQRALRLLEEAGWRNRGGVMVNAAGEPFEFEITFGQGSESTLQMVTYLQQAMAEVGIRLTLRPIDWSVLQSTLNARDFDAITFAWSASAPENDPNQIWHSSSIQNQGDNFIQWASPEADRLIEEGRRTLDFDRRMLVWRELHRHFHEEQPYTYLSELPWLRFITQRTRNFQEYASGLEYYDLWVKP